MSKQSSSHNQQWQKYTRALVPADKSFLALLQKMTIPDQMFKHELQEDETLPNFIKEKHPKEGRRSKFFCKAPGDSNKQRTSLSLSFSLSLSLSTSGILNTTRVCCKVAKNQPHLQYLTSTPLQLLVLIKLKCKQKWLQRHTK